MLQLPRSYLVRPTRTLCQHVLRKYRSNNVVVTKQQQLQQQQQQHQQPQQQDEQLFLLLAITAGSGSRGVAFSRVYK